MTVPPPLKGRLPGDPRHAKKKKVNPNRVGGGEPGGGNKNVFWRPAILEACNGEDPQVAGIGEGEVEGGPLLEGLEGGTPREGEVEGGPLLEGLEGGSSLEVKVEGGPLLEGLEGGSRGTPHPHS
ncbi:unnamed protein product [Boreogadus saida]